MSGISNYGNYNFRAPKAGGTGKTNGNSGTSGTGAASNASSNDTHYYPYDASSDAFIGGSFAGITVTPSGAEPNMSWETIKPGMHIIDPETGESKGIIYHHEEGDPASTGDMPEGTIY